MGLLGEPTRRRTVLLGPAPLRHPTVRRPAPTHPGYVQVWFSTGLLQSNYYLMRCNILLCDVVMIRVIIWHYKVRYFLVQCDCIWFSFSRIEISEHASHEKGLQRQIGVGTLVSHQKRRAAVVPQISRGSPAGFVFPSVYIGFRLFVPPETRSVCWWIKGSVASWANRPVGVPCCPSPPRLAVLPCAAPSRPARDMFGFLDLTDIFKATKHSVTYIMRNHAMWSLRQC